MNRSWIIWLSAALGACASEPQQAAAPPFVPPGDDYYIGACREAGFTLPDALNSCASIMRARDVNAARAATYSLPAASAPSPAAANTSGGMDSETLLRLLMALSYMGQASQPSRLPIPQSTVLGAGAAGFAGLPYPYLATPSSQMPTDGITCTQMGPFTRCW